MRSLEKCIDDIINSKNIAIFCHTTPDADTLASAVALKKIIKQNIDIETNPKQIDIFVDADEICDTNAAIIKGVSIKQQSTEKYDLAISVDAADLTRLGRWQELFESTLNTINIDHHATNTYFAKNNLVLKTSSTCEAIYMLAKIKNLTMSDDVLNLLYSGIITDTNNLTQGVITVNTHKVIAEMMLRHINIDALKEHFFQNNPKSKAYLLQKALNSLRFSASDRIAFMKLTKQDLQDADATFDDSVGIVNHGIEIKGVDIAILAIKQEDNSYYVSLRGKNGIDVGHISVQFGGGGHEGMAAFQYKGLLTELNPLLTKACKEELAKHPREELGENLFFGDDDENNDKKEENLNNK